MLLSKRFCAQRSRYGLTVIALTLAMSGGGQAAEEERSVRAGQADYKTLCASCHGVDGTGKGPAAEVFITKPTDLTRLAANNGGIFPHDRVFRIIDGRAELKAHGSRSMPVWGLNFGWLSRDEKDADVKRRINNIIAYLESIQK